jgi:hypothetical protein
MSSRFLRISLVVFGTVIALFAGLSASTADAQVLNPGNGHYYQLINAGGPITWSAASQSASGMAFGGYPGHLATITSSAENSFIKNDIVTIAGDFWIGGYSIGPGSDPASWRWCTGEPWVYSSWAQDEPNYDFEDYLMIYGIDDHWGNWNNVEENVSYVTGYVVEFDTPLVPPVPAFSPLGVLSLVLTIGVAALILMRRRLTTRND